MNFYLPTDGVIHHDTTLDEPFLRRFPLEKRYGVVAYSNLKMRLYRQLNERCMTEGPRRTSSGAPYIIQAKAHDRFNAWRRQYDRGVRILMRSEGNDMVDTFKQQIRLLTPEKCVTFDSDHDMDDGDGDVKGTGLTTTCGKSVVIDPVAKAVDAPTTMKCTIERMRKRGGWPIYAVAACDVTVGSCRGGLYATLKTATKGSGGISMRVAGTDYEVAPPFSGCISMASRGIFSTYDAEEPVALGKAATDAKAMFYELCIPPCRQDDAKRRMRIFNGGVVIKADDDRPWKIVDYTDIDDDVKEDVLFNPAVVLKGLALYGGTGESGAAFHHMLPAEFMARLCG